MRILGIETSCDETAIALVERGEDNRVLAERIKSQIPLHEKYGGVVPEIASRNHYEVIDALFGMTLEDAGAAAGDIDLISLTLGPGLIGSLLIGLSFAKGLALTSKLPLVTVDHIQAHIESAFISHPAIRYPLVALVVSGGHTTLFYVESRFNLHVLAKTRDDAAGEILDKIVKHFGLGYPGGPILDAIYPQGDAGRFRFTTPKISDGSADFSFSGYKTAVLRLAREQGAEPGTQVFKDLVASFLTAVVDYMLDKAFSAVDTYQAKSLIVAGGVARNTLLRERFSAAAGRQKTALYFPEPHYCTDNAAMIAWLGYEKYTAYPSLNYFDLYLNSYSKALFRDHKKFR